MTDEVLPFEQPGPLPHGRERFEILLVGVGGQGVLTAAKILGGGLTGFGAMFLAMKFIVPSVHHWLTRRSPARTPGAVPGAVQRVRRSGCSGVNPDA